MYAEVAISTGWTFEYIGQWLTLPRLKAMYAHWHQYPPMHITAALFAGAGTRTAAPLLPSKTAAANEADHETAAYVQSMPMMQPRLPGK